LENRELVLQGLQEFAQGNIDDLRRQMKDMQERLERMSQPAKKDE